MFKFWRGVGWLRSGCITALPNGSRVRPWGAAGADAVAAGIVGRLQFGGVRVSPPPSNQLPNPHIQTLPLIMGQGPAMARARTVSHHRRAETAVQIVGHTPVRPVSSFHKETGSNSGPPWRSTLRSKQMAGGPLFGGD